MMADNATQVAHDKLEGLDLEALGLTDAVIDAVGLEKAALDFYMAGAWGSLERQGAAGYDGYGFVTTAGADYLVTPDLLLGGSVFYEWGRLEYDALINGKVVRDGWPGDVYGGDVTLTNGDLLSADDWGVTWSMGLRRRLSGFAPGTWVSGVLNGRNVSLEYSRSSFGRNNTSQSFEGTHQTLRQIRHNKYRLHSRLGWICSCLVSF